MPSKQPLINFFLCEIDNDNKFIKTNICLKARTSLSAAKKAYRHNKNLVDIFVIDDQNNIYHHVSTTFFTKKKEHKLRR